MRKTKTIRNQATKTWIRQSRTINKTMHHQHTIESTSDVGNSTVALPNMNQMPTELEKNIQGDNTTTTESYDTNKCHTPLKKQERPTTIQKGKIQPKILTYPNISSVYHK